MLTAGDIVAMFKQRHAARHPLINKAQEVREVYNGNVDVVLPELNRNEKPSVANLLQQGLDQTAMRIASTLPTLFCPPQREGFKKWEDLADTKRKALMGMWAANAWDIIQAQRARHLIGYASSPVVIRPPSGYEDPYPCWYVRDPLTAFPAMSGRMNDLEPPDCIFAYSRTYAWLKLNYPEATARLDAGRDPKPDDKFQILEYDGPDEIVLLAQGRGDRNDYQPSFGTETEVLERMENRTGMCLVVMPGRLVLDADHPQGQFDGMLGMFQAQARLAALELIAITEGVFPKEWAVSRPNETVKIITVADGRQGVIGEIQGGEMVSTAYNPGYKTDSAIDRLERYQRLEGRVPADFGGESASNVRTDRRGNSIMSATVDFTVAEGQKLLARSYEKENVRAMEVMKAYMPAPRSYYVNWKGAKGLVDYTPAEAFEDTTNFVRFPLPGTDVNGLAVAAGQRIGLGTMSKRTFTELDPLVDDPEMEHDRIITDGLETALLQGITQQVVAGGIPPSDVARLMELVARDKMELADAVTQVQKEAQERQASNGPPGTPAGPVEPGSPEAQPGIAQPGAGAEAGTVGPSENTAGLAQLLRSLHSAGTTPTTTNVPAASSA